MTPRRHILTKLEPAPAPGERRITERSRVPQSDAMQHPIRWQIVDLDELEIVRQAGSWPGLRRARALDSTDNDVVLIWECVPLPGHDAGLLRHCCVRSGAASRHTAVTMPPARVIRDRITVRTRQTWMTPHSSTPTDRSTMLVSSPVGSGYSGAAAKGRRSW